jgi:hypothetical protein
MMDEIENLHEKYPEDKYYWTSNLNKAAFLMCNWLRPTEKIIEGRPTKVLTLYRPGHEITATDASNPDEVRWIFERSPELTAHNDAIAAGQLYPHGDDFVSNRNRLLDDVKEAQRKQGEKNAQRR